jgi:hypothetical protein
LEPCAYIQAWYRLTVSCSETRPNAKSKNDTDEESAAYEFPDNLIGKWYTMGGTKSYDIILTIVKKLKRKKHLKIKIMYPLPTVKITYQEKPLSEKYYNEHPEIQQMYPYVVQSGKSLSIFERLFYGITILIG